MAEQSGAPEKRVEKTGTPEKAAAPDKGPEKAAAATPAEGKADAQGKEEAEKAKKEKEEQEKKKEIEKGEALEKRLRQLEERGGRTKWVAALAVAALACAVSAIVRAAALARPAPPPAILQAEGIVLNDADGRFRAEIGQYKGGWGIFLFDNKVIQLHAGDQAAGAVPQAELRIAEGDNRLIIRGLAPQKSAVDLGVNKLGWPCLTVFDKEAGARRAEVGETEVPSEGKLEKRAPDSVVLSDKQGNPISKTGEAATDFAPVAPATPAR